ncbi:hypothetical protein [Paenibacillus sp. 1011MAR3C5]|uniref:hypothetical protein n=1 Tax=Paenibacillus sp. 1011MAR3C5 TaxID=1675787 RepID=UPI0011C4A418|nr:hypothetical protein [Paenibacillus sp. 1011MAR3C5]
MKTEELETMFDHAFRESVTLTRFVPDTEESWTRLQKKLAKRYRIRRRMGLFKVLPFIVVSFLLGAFLFGTPTVSNAFQQVATVIKQDIFGISDDTTSHNLIPKTAPPPDYKLFYD